MPIWLQIVLGIISGLGALGTLFGFAAYFAERAKHKAAKKNKTEDEAEEQERQDKEELEAAREAKRQASYEVAFRAIIREENASIKEDIAEIKRDLAVNTEGTVTSLRDRMHAILDESRDKGYATPGTKANWDDLYNTYKKLGGNHFKEYVDRWKETLNKFPDEPQSKPRKSSRTRSSSRGVRLPSYQNNILMPGAKAPIDDKKIKEILGATQAKVTVIADDSADKKNK